MSGLTIRLAALLTLTTLAACDIGDGTTLQEPTTPTTVAPIDTTPLETLPLDLPVIDDPILDGTPAIDSFPVDQNPAASDGFTLFAPWADHAPIDVLYTCDGSNSSPALSWTNVPDGTQQLAISLVDESNLSNGRPFIHWVVAGLDASTDRIRSDELPAGAIQGLNFFGDVGYTGPCPDPGTTGTFTLTVFALNQQIELADGTPAAELLDVLATVAIGSASSTGTAAR